MKLSIDEALRQGIAAHKEGNIQEADRLYTAILGTQPKHPDANHNMGVLAVGIGKVDAALPFLKTALESNPKIEQFWLSYIDALIKLGQFDGARQVLAQAQRELPTSGAFVGLKERLSSKFKDETNNFYPAQGELNKLSQCYQAKQYDEAERLALAMTKDFPKYPFGWKVLGAIFGHTGRSDEALNANIKAILVHPQDAEAYNNLGNILLELGSLERAVLVYKHTIVLQPKLVLAHYNLGNVMRQLDRLKDAEKSLRYAIELKPDYAEAYNNLGNILQEVGRLEEAEVSLKQAISLKFDYARAHSNLGATLKELNRLDEAEASLKQAIELNPDYHVAHYNLGNTLNGSGKHKEAVVRFKKSIQLNPTYTSAYVNLGVAQTDLGLYGKSITTFNKTLKLKPDYKDAYSNLSLALRFFKAKNFSSSLEKIYIDILNLETVIRPADIVSSIIIFLKYHRSIQDAIYLSNQKNIPDSAFNIFKGLSEVPLFLKIIELCPIPDLEIENLLQQLRRFFLLKRHSISKNDNSLHLQSALALQCFANEFIYQETKEETKAVESLETQLQESSFKAEKLSSYDIACLASYRPLHNYDWVKDMVPPQDLRPIFTRQVFEVQKELTLRDDIPRLNPITDNISLVVQNQYEENPYPRWFSTKLESNPITVKKLIHQMELKYISTKNPFSESPKILLAGCGTGQHSLSTANKFSNSHITAIDLSLSSLSYAKRKTQEFGFSNIDYIQADILDLGMLDKKFDIIESVGVLHHMSDPFLGWKILSACLKSGGIIKIGLYSELGRQPVVRARDMFVKQNIRPDKIDMLEFRSEIINMNDSTLDILRESGDFFSTSTLRDLIFHVQEHRFTIPQISKMLDELELVFIGFDFANKKVLKFFRASYSSPDDLYDLEKWHQFEILNPTLFSGMYQFYAQKL